MQFSMRGSYFTVCGKNNYKKVVYIFMYINVCIINYHKLNDFVFVSTLINIIMYILRGASSLPTLPRETSI